MRTMLTVSISLLVSLAVTAAGTSKYHLSSSEVKASASVYGLDMQSEGKVITDNVEAYEKRLEMIRGARKSLDLAYYIFSQDESSSYLVKEIVKAANRGVRVRILLDYLTNYANLDWLMALSKSVDSSNGGSIEFRLYGRPSANIIKDMIYLSTACSDKNNVKGRETECAAEKAPVADQINKLSKEDAINYNTGYSGIILSGFYAKSGATIKHAIVNGAKINPSSLGGGKPLSKEDKQGLTKLFKLYRDAKFGGSISAGLKLQLAIMTGGQAKMIIEMLDKYLPAGSTGYDSNRQRDWSHFTDFLHHKLLLSDVSQLLIGGRNIENSYHMEFNPSGKYTFMDTDVYFDMSQESGVKLEGTFDRLWNFKEFVATTSDIYKHAPNDYQVEIDTCVSNEGELLSQKIQSSGKVPSKEEKNQLEEQILGKCIMSAAKNLASSDLTIKSRLKRQKLTLQKMEELATVFERDLKKSPEGKPSFKIDAKAVVSYIENLTFTHKNTKDRIYGSNKEKEKEHGKYIHNLWVKGLLNTCTSDRKQTVYLHQAYFFLPSNLLSTIAEMTKTAKRSRLRPAYKDLDCSNVTIKILTNSIPTSDLNIINVYARYQMQALFKAIETSKYKSQAAKIEYYEYKSQGEHNKSLHTKVSILGDKAIIGSANADIRSYMMDTNNGVFIENAPEFISSYGKYMEEILSDSSLVTRVDQDFREYKKYEAASHKALHQQTEALVDQMGEFARSQGKAWPTEGRLWTIKQLITNDGEDVLKASELATKFYTNITDENMKQIEKSNSSDAKYILRGMKMILPELNEFDTLYMPL